MSEFGLHGMALTWFKLFLLLRVKTLIFFIDINIFQVFLIRNSKWVRTMSGKKISLS
jgi:hypothetical protein